MRTFDFTPLYRSTVGFDRMFDRLDNSIRPDWPPYDIERVGEDEYRISMAVAGFSADEIELTQQGSNLLVSGQKTGDQDARHEVLHGVSPTAISSRRSAWLTTSGSPMRRSKTGSSPCGLFVRCPSS